MAGHFQNAQASCNKSDATFRKPHAKNSHGFPGCGVILMLVFVTYLFLHLCCVPIFFFFFFTFFHHLCLQHSVLYQKPSCCLSLMLYFTYPFIYSSICPYLSFHKATQSSS